MIANGYTLLSLLLSLLELATGGVLLVTAPGISQISRFDMDRWGDYWRFTTRSMRQLVSDAFQPSDVVVRSYGNALAATAFLYGVSARELRKGDLDQHDPDYELLISVRAMRSPE